MKWPSTLGGRDRSSQYNDYVIPLSAEEKIVQTQRMHMVSQKDLNKAVKFLDKALSHYSEARFGTTKAVELLAKEKKQLLDLQEKIKQLTYNNLPYKELKEAQINEQEFYQRRRWLTKKRGVILSVILGNLCLYASGLMLSDGNLLGLGVLYSIVTVVVAYLRWANQGEKTLKSSHKVGPKIW